MKHSIRTLAVLGLAAILAPAAVRADEANTDEMEELRATLGNLTQQLNEAKTKMDTGVNFGVNTDLRYDYQKWNPANATPNPVGGSAASPLVSPALTNTAPNGIDAIYAKRVEVEFKGKLLSSTQWHLQFDFAALKLEDLGVEVNKISFVPMMDTPGWEWNLKIGQFRQPFGIENQTGSSSTPFSERAIIDGGTNPAGYGKMVGERVMGLHAWHEKSFRGFGYKIQATLANDTGDQNAGTSNPNGGKLFGQAVNSASFPSTNQSTDEGFAGIGRVGLDLNFFPSVAKLNVGGSMAHNTTDSVFFTTSALKEGWTDTWGLDGTLDIPAANTKLWGEWVAQDTYGHSNPQNADLVWLTRGEGWYAVSSMQLLKFISKDAPAVDFNVRYESMVKDINAAANAAWFKAASEQAITYGIKWNWVGKNYTSANYTIYGLNGDFSALAGAELFILQQQFNF